MKDGYWHKTRGRFLGDSEVPDSEKDRRIMFKEEEDFKNTEKDYVSRFGNQVGKPITNQTHADESDR